MNAPGPVPRRQPTALAAAKSENLHLAVNLSLQELLTCLAAVAAATSAMKKTTKNANRPRVS